MYMTMINKFLILTFIFSLGFFLSVNAYEIDSFYDIGDVNKKEENYLNNVKHYERLLTIENQGETIKKFDIEDIDKQSSLERKIDQKSEALKHFLTFEHDKLPNLDGTWYLSKTFKKRLNPIIVLKKPITFYHCSSRMPIQNLDISHKRVQLNARGIDYFTFNPKNPNTKDIYHDGVNDKELEYINFGFKGEVDAHDLTYAYTLKTDNHITDNLRNLRQIQLHGRLNYQTISKNLIIAKGYEVQESPECEGFLVDEVEIRLVRVNGNSGGEGGLPLLEQPAYANDQSPEQGLQFDSAKDKSGIDASSNYNKKGGVPGMW